MAGEKEEIPESVLRSLQASGFPFQTAIEHAIRGVSGWRIPVSEYPWQGLDGKDHFLDMIASSRQFLLTIECKKTDDEHWIFLCPQGLSSIDQTEDFNCIESGEYASLPKPRNLYLTRRLSPQSPSSEFCVIGKTDPKKIKTQGEQRLLERDGSLLIRATNALANDSNIRKAFSPATPPWLLVPMIVTNAELYVVRYKPSEISLKKGAFENWPTSKERAPWVRFSKAFTAGSARESWERSIFVVSASELTNFLNLLEVSPA